MRRWKGLAIGALLATVLSGCATPPEGDPDALQRWLAQWEKETPEGSLASLSGLSGSSDGVDGEGVTVDFEEPTDVTVIEFSCFGPETMSVDITMGDADTSRTTRVDDLSCDDSAHSLDQALPDAMTVTANGVSTDGPGAWGVVVRGDG